MSKLKKGGKKVSKNFFYGSDNTTEINKNF